jgi:hypothetical protein
MKPNPTPLPFASVAVVADRVIEETRASEVECASAAEDGEDGREERETKKRDVADSDA